MLLRVTIDIFSGRENPVVELRDKQAEEALQRLRPAEPLEGTDADTAASDFRLGYRGLAIEQAEERTDMLPASFRLAHGELFGEGLAHRIDDSTFEDYILETVELERFGLGADFREMLKTEKKNAREARDNEEARRIILPCFPLFKRILEENKIAPCAPLYEPGWWNDGGQRQRHNNCYNYGCNYRTDTFAQPGRAAGAMYTAITAADVKAGAVADGLIDSPYANNNPPDEGQLVALVIWPGHDFHWYRMNRNCSWSHKPGSTKVTNRDNSGAKIKDPRSADRGPYTEFATFMVVKHGHVILK
jgi:hypothetical protein